MTKEQIKAWEASVALAGKMTRLGAPDVYIHVKASTILAIKEVTYTALDRWDSGAWEIEECLELLRATVKKPLPMDEKSVAMRGKGRIHGKKKI